MWAVTVIGAPKKAAAQAIENLEKNARGWYGGAVGMISLNGDINTGILIRTVHLRGVDGRVSGRRDAALRFRSGNGGAGDAAESHRFLPRAGAAETQPAHEAERRSSSAEGRGLKLLLVDNDDCFIHTLANYARQTGAEVVTYRAGFPRRPDRPNSRPSLILISPGPGRPARFRRAGPGPPRGADGNTRCSASAWDCRASLRRLAVSWACSIIRCTASRPWYSIAARGFLKGCRKLPSGPLSFAVRETRDLSGLPGSHGRVRGWGHHGRPAPRLAHGGGAVSSGVDSDG